MRSRPKPKKYDSMKSALWWATTCRHGVRCVACGRPRQETGALQAHHVIDKSWLDAVAKTLRLDNDARNDLLWDVRNGVPICTRCHELHTNAHKRIPRDHLPEAVWEFARAVDALLGTQAATCRVEREYPS